MNPLDFKAEAITFKATANGILFSLANCLDLLSRSEEHWRKRLEKEQVARKRAEEKFRRAVSITIIDNFVLRAESFTFVVQDLRSYQLILHTQSASMAHFLEEFQV